MRDYSKKEKFLFITLSVVIAVGIGFRVYQGWIAPAGKEIEIITSDQTADYKITTETDGEKVPIKQEDEQKIVIHVAGAVNNPGVYTLKENCRVFEAVEAAGGFSEDARVEAINLASRLYDGQKVYVPREGDEYSPALFYGDDSPAKINLNTADQNELEKLPGIGPAKARAIIQDRQRNGPFKSIEDITRVSGIGDKTLENLRDLITI